MTAVRAWAILGLVLGAVGSTAATAVAEEALPSWAREAMAAPTPSDATGSKAVVLLTSGSIEMVGADRYVERHRRVVRILAHDGNAEAVASALYRTDGGAVRSLKAWIVAPSGESREIPNKEAVDVSLAGNDIYSEARVRSLSGASDAIPGATFASETAVEGRYAFAQFEWYFQDELPTVRSEFAFRPLHEWSVQSTMLNGDSLAPAEKDGWRIWTRAGLAPIKDEPYAPPLSSLAPRLAVSALPPANTQVKMKPFVQWNEVSAWLQAVSAPSGSITPKVAARAGALTAATATPEGKIRAVAAFCQSVNYISIQMGTSRGGGYVPHAAEQVLTNGYGDCKDKSNLMRTMLRALGIDAYLCVISAFDADYVREGWPTPAQFNHCIVAVRSDDSATCSIDSPTLGRLVLFDPTDPSTTWGDLPESEQGGWALLIAAPGGDLVRVPAAAPLRGGHRRRIEASIAADGTVTGSIRIEATGAGAAEWRTAARGRGSEGLAASPELWLGATITAADVDSFSEDNRSGSGAYAARATFRIPKLGRAMNGSLIVLEPGKLSTIRIPTPVAARAAPMMIPRVGESDELRISLPSNFGVDGMPPTVSIEAAYGTYKASYRVDGSMVSIDRVLELRRTVVPAAQSAEAREFLRKVKRALDTPLVLAKR